MVDRWETRTPDVEHVRRGDDSRPDGDIPFRGNHRESGSVRDGGVDWAFRSEHRERMGGWSSSEGEDGISAIRIGSDAGPAPHSARLERRGEEMIHTSALSP